MNDNGLLIGIIFVPGVIALLLVGLFTHAYRQNRLPFIRAWQLGWGCYFLSYAFQWFYYTGTNSLPILWLGNVLLAGVVVSLYLSEKLMDRKFAWHWLEAAGAFALLAWISWAAPFELQHQPLAVLPLFGANVPLSPKLGLALILAVCAARFFRRGRARRSSSYLFLTVSLLLWGALLLSHQFSGLIGSIFTGGGHMLGPLPQTMIAIAMLMILHDYQRRGAEENLIAFHHLEADFNRILTPAQILPKLEKLLRRLAAVANMDGAMLFVLDPFRGVLPSAQVCLRNGSLTQLEAAAAPAISKLLGISSNNPGSPLVEISVAQLRKHDDPLLGRLADLFEAQGVSGITVQAIAARDQQFAALMLVEKKAVKLGNAQRGLLVTFALQLSTTLSKYVLLHESQRRTREFELLTEIGRVVSSHLDPDDVLRVIHRELGRLFDTNTFYVAFQKGDKICFEFETELGEICPKRERLLSYGFSEHILKTGEPLLIESGMEQVRDELGVVPIVRPAKCFCGVPVIMADRPAGVMAVMHYEREFVYTRRDLEILEVAARQLATSFENARRFAGEQQRSRYLAFLNNVFKTAITSQDAEHMLIEIVHETRQSFQFHHVSIGMVDYNTKDIELKAEAGHSGGPRNKRLPLGAGIIGRVARTNEMVLEQHESDRPMGIVPGSRSVLCLPIRHGQTLMGLLNIECDTTQAFHPDDVLMLRTLADLLATALNNAVAFQRMEQQSITDPLTGLKTRHFFIESLQGEMKRALRAERPFSVVLVDLDRFKEVNDSMGHLEGDLVLARIGRLLDQKVRQSNVVARYGGDEFVILMPETGLEQASILSERLRLWLATDPMLKEHNVTGSFGVATFPLHGSALEDIIRVADAGMYLSKRAGGNRVSYIDVTVESASQGEQRQVIASYLEAYLRRDHVATVEEITGALQKIAAAVTTDTPELALREAIFTVMRAVEMREIHAAGHGEAVASYARAIASGLSPSGDELADLIFAAQVHDVGKIVVPEAILNKATPLSFEEYRLVQSHAREGARILAAIPGTGRVWQFVLHHQECFDGNGYPDGLKGEEIPLGARIIAIAQAFVKMTTNRPFADSKTPAEAILELERMSGKQFDGALVHLLVEQLKGNKAAKI